MKTYYQMQNPDSINSVLETSEGISRTPDTIRDDIDASINISTDTIKRSFVLLDKKNQGTPLSPEITYNKFPNINTIKGLFEEVYNELALIRKKSSQNPTVNLKNRAKVLEGGLLTAETVIRNDVPLNREELQSALDMNAEDFYGLRLKEGTNTTNSVIV